MVQPGLFSNLQCRNGESNSRQFSGISFWVTLIREALPTELPWLQHSSTLLDVSWTLICLGNCNSPTSHIPTSLYTAQFNHYRFRSTLSLEYWYRVRNQNQNRHSCRIYSCVPGSNWTLLEVSRTLSSLGSCNRPTTNITFAEDSPI